MWCCHRRRSARVLAEFACGVAIKLSKHESLISNPANPITGHARIGFERLIREHKVAVVPGPAFGMTDGCYFRVAYGALQKATVAEGIGRLVKGLRAIGS